jgi:sigma-B regulation protein RsbU (phosphoserine phosphatase)
MLPVKTRGAERAALGILKNSADFRAPDIKLGKAIAEYAGMHIDNFLMFQRSIEYTRLQTEMDLAKRVHASLLPKSLPQIPGLDLGTICLPASQVGGDFYDYVEKPGQPFTFMVGDISGKGVPAALLMAMTRTLIRKEANDHPIITPEGILRQINNDLYAEFTELGMFATVFVGQYHPENRRLIYANAGHSPVYYCPAGGSASLLAADGAPLGILPVSQSKDQCVQFKQGDVFVVGTDGLSDARNPRMEYFGYDRLRMMVESLTCHPAREIAETIICTVTDFADKGLRIDDQTLIVLKCLA